MLWKHHVDCLIYFAINFKMISTRYVFETCIFRVLIANL